ncbi:MAG: anti-sigma factor antagonist [Oscillospiraceae bacterium]|nr:anti-sigma factor antagonist [Oscillospiraceae bacterium]
MVKIYNDGKRITAALYGDLDHHAAREMRAELDDVISHSRPELLILDLENVGFMDSSGIGLILGRTRSLKAVGGELLIKNASSEIAAVIKLSGLGNLIAAKSKSGV